MNKLIVSLFVAALMFSFAAHTTFAQASTGAVTGKAVRWNGDPIVGATIRVLAGPLETDKELSRTTTGADGSYALNVPADQPYWIHIDTLGTWWGYSYQTPFTLRPSEQISNVFFALGPRDVHELALPAPTSSLAPAVSAPAPEVKAPTIQDFTNLNIQRPATAPVVAAPAAPVSNVKPAVGLNEVPAAPQKPVSNVKPAIGLNEVPAAPQKPVSNVKPAIGLNEVPAAPQTLPPTGAPGGADMSLLLLAGALALLVSGLGFRRLHNT